MMRAPVSERSCRVCGCTDNRACFGGCHWIGPDLCSACSWGGPASGRGHGPDDEGGEFDSFVEIGPDDAPAGALS